MLSRLQNALKNGSSLIGADASFYMHEMAEAHMMTKGMAYESAHAAALQMYQVSPFSVYAPEVISAMPQFFNQNWTNFWGLK